MLCQKVCVVPFGIMAMVSVEEDEEPAGWLFDLLHANIAQTATATIPAAKTRRICYSIKGLKAPKAPGGSTEDGILFTLGAFVNGCADNLDNFAISGGKSANGPIRSKH